MLLSGFRFKALRTSSVMQAVLMGAQYRVSVIFGAGNVRKEGCGDLIFVNFVPYYNRPDISQAFLLS